MRWCRGVTREVILIGRYAIKAPSFRSWRLFLRGLLANGQEVEWSRTRDERLCPVRFWIPGGWLIVMDRCEPIVEVDYDKFGGLPTESKVENYGLLRGRVVLLDYRS